MKHLFALALALLMLPSMAGCGRNENAEEAKTPLYVVTEQKNYSTDKLSSVSTFQYDDHGRPTAIELTYTDGTIRRSELTYDEYGNRIQEKITYKMTDTAEWITHVTNYTLTYTDGRITHCESSDNGEPIGSMDLHYDSIGNLVLVEYDANYVEKLRICWNSFEYDATGRLIQETTCRSYPNYDSGGIEGCYYAIHRVDYSYDSSGNLSHYSASNAVSNDPVAYNQADSLEYNPTGDQWTFVTDKDGHLVCNNLKPDSDYTNEQFSIMDSLKSESCVFDDHGNLVKTSGTEYSYQAIELRTSDAQIAKRLMHGIAEGINSSTFFACMDPLFLRICPMVLYVPQSYFPFYYLIPYPMW